MKNIRLIVVDPPDEGFLEKNEMFFEIVKKRHKWPFQVRYDGSRDAE